VEARTIGARISEFWNRFWVRSFVVVGGTFLVLVLVLVLVGGMVEISSSSFMMVLSCLCQCF